ncbi:hypothetical protein Palpr_2131 [Paludibacter propionicigenes WB4]|uniref:Uncharacterized protein n=1 Tax=Paludibacter propionicigenes (strain DSM 17365 / JCM 13257 / WB4) TaxID=694427 RepID=E4T6C3_PALPW|nr:hypothetical protein [Paludibacter propionicigenes]ADQ80267.1 hypothetical protein Palpr_2131 [Paludibacter propionicigenes WB4]
MSTSKVGAWTAYSTSISAEAMAAFKEALKGHVGVNYTPLAVASQMVSGTNYRFLCDAQVVYPDAPHYGALVPVYKPLNGPAVLSAPIKPIE